MDIYINPPNSTAFINHYKATLQSAILESANGKVAPIDISDRDKAEPPLFKLHLTLHIYDKACLLKTSPLTTDSRKLELEL